MIALSLQIILLASIHKERQSEQNRKRSKNKWQASKKIFRFCVHFRLVWTQLNGCIRVCVKRHEWVLWQEMVVFILNANADVRAHLHQASASTLWQLCDDAYDPVLIENIRVTPEWSCNPFSSVSIVFNENRIVSIIAELWQQWCWRSV